MRFNASSSTTTIEKKKVSLREWCCVIRLCIGAWVFVIEYVLIIEKDMRNANSEVVLWSDDVNNKE